MLFPPFFVIPAKAGIQSGNPEEIKIKKELILKIK